MVKFEWDILDMRSAAGVVTQVWFRLTAREGAREQSLQGSVTLARPDEGAALTAYTKLTEKQVIAWVKAHPAAEDFKKRAAAALQQPDPTELPEDAGLPWAAAAEK